VSDHVLTRVQDGILRVEMHRPAKRNALTLDMYDAMAAALRQADGDPAVRVVYVAGSDGTFTAGNDLTDFLQQPPTGESSPVFRFLAALMEARKPLVAEVQGVAIGIGTTMLLHCDLVYAGQSARFQLPFVNLGLVPEAGSSLILPQLAGHRRAAELLMLGEPFSAQEAQALGIVNAVHPDEELADVAWRKALALAAKPPEALRLTKTLMRRAAAGPVQESVRAESQVFVERLGSPEAREALRAFAERRPPDFSRFT
jgi:enoyl-CoA hydratase/carnithine racemase